MVGQLRQQNSQAKNLGRNLKVKTPFQTQKRKKKQKEMMNTLKLQNIRKRT